MSGVVGLLVAAALLLWPRRRRRRVTARRPPASTAQAGPALPMPVLLDLVRAALDAGLPPGRALEAVWALAPSSVDERDRRALLTLAGGESADGRDGPATVAAELTSLARALVLASRTGASIGVLLRQAARDERAARRRRASVAAARLGVRLVLPLGLTTLLST